MIDHAIVMAASPGRKMEQLTRTRPKAMLPILGNPLIARVMEPLYQAGLRRFTIVMGEREGDIATWLHEHWHKDVSLGFALQGHQRGTASTLFATRHLIDGPVIITSCDVLLQPGHIAGLRSYFEVRSVDVAALSLFTAPDEAAEVAGVLLDPRGQVFFISEKPMGAHQDHRVALPIYAFTPRVLEYLDRVPLDKISGERVLSAAIQLMIDDGGLVGALEAPWRLRLDAPDDLRAANVHFLSQSGQSVIESKLPDSVRIIDPVYIESAVSVGMNAVIGPNTYIESRSVIGAGTHIHGSVVLGQTVGANLHIEAELIDKERN